MELIHGFQEIASVTTMLLIFGGVFGGLVIGALPGLSAFTALAIMLPFTFGMRMRCARWACSAFLKEWSRVMEPRRYRR